MTRDHLGALLRVVGGEDGLHLGQRHVELPQLVDHLCSRDLFGRVVAVTRRRVHRIRLEEFGRMVATQGPHAQTRQRGELPDGQAGAQQLSSLLTLSSGETAQ